MFRKESHIFTSYSVYLLLIGFITFVSVSQAQVLTPLAGARSWGMASGAATLTDAWAVWNNAAGLAMLPSPTAMLAYDRPFGMKGLQSMGIGYIHPLKKSVTGIGISRLGDELYQTHTFSLAYSRVVENIRVGVRLGYQQTGIQETNVYHACTADLGAIATLIPHQLTLGFTVHTPLAATLPERLPPAMQVGLAYTPVATLLLIAEAEKEMDYAATFKAGAEYEIVSHLFLRTGIHTQPNFYTFGIGIHPRKLQLDYAVRTHPVLGLSHQLSLSMTFRKKKPASQPSCVCND